MISLREYDRTINESEARIRYLESVFAKIEKLGGKNTEQQYQKLRAMKNELLVVKREREREAKVRTLIWWLNQQQHEAITEQQVQSLPQYLQELYDDREGRPGRGRLWVDNEVTTGNPCVDPWPSTPLAEELSNSGGLVIRHEDYDAVKYLPGVVTDMRLVELSRQLTESDVA